MIHVRQATEADHQAIVDIINQVISAKTFTAFTEETSVAEKADWFAVHQASAYPLMVAEYDEHVVGWVSLSAYRPGREALKHTVEVSYGVAEQMRRKGVGTAMMTAITAQAKALGHRIVFAIIFDNNVATRKLLDKFGFELWGHLPDVALLNGTLIGHDYVGRRL
ncbi:MAG: N-acetyltransferase [Deltaproteobacteria bacterium]|nr:N-acetyltransferase [Deltaproteobacteria bacterium]MBN2672740.1 N-acetyltransferase [Deltaproteobacteria bacterium]